MTTHAADPSRPDQFKSSFAKLLPTIEEEWPEVDHAELQATEGELSQVAAVVAAKADRTKQTIRRHLLEILANVEAAEAARAHGNGARKHANGGGKGSADDAPEFPHMEDVLGAIKRLEKFAAAEAQRMGRNIGPAAETKVKENLLTSLLIALGLGFLFGFILRGSGRRH